MAIKQMYYLYHQWFAFYCFNKNFNVNMKILLTSDKLIRNTIINFIRLSECKIFNIRDQVGNNSAIRF